MAETSVYSCDRIGVGTSGEVASGEIRAFVDHCAVAVAVAVVGVVRSEVQPV
jgi:hypothetical protein